VLLFGSAPFNFFTIARSLMAKARAGFIAKADFYHSNCPPIDLLTIAGGVASSELPTKEVTE
jgi:hypothetical protein